MLELSLLPDKTLKSTFSVSPFSSVMVKSDVMLTLSKLPSIATILSNMYQLSCRMYALTLNAGTWSVVFDAPVDLKAVVFNGDTI